MRTTEIQGSARAHVGSRGQGVTIPQSLHGRTFPRQGLDLGGAHSEPPLQQLPLGRVFPVLVHHVDGQGTVPVTM